MTFDPIGNALRSVHERIHGDDRGEVASYIPELSKADPDHFGLALTSADGRSYATGDAGVAFTIQSISKPFVLALALDDRGLDGVTERVGVEPSGEAYNAISLDPTTGAPDNPMINAGAIAVTGMVAGADAKERFERIRTTLGRFAGRELDVDEAVFDSERTTGDRNRAFGYLLRHSGAIDGSANETVDTYIRQCSLLVTATDLSVMGATLANAGRNPATGVQVVEEIVAEQVMAIMATCGMYDASGDWLLRVGLPAKSGVGGGLVAVSPSQFGIGIFSPPLDEQGNSVRAVEAARALSKEFSLHLLHQTAPLAPAVRIEECDGSSGPGGADVVLTFSGYLEFTSMERALAAIEPVRERWHDADRTPTVLVDFTRVTRCHPLAAALLDALAADLAEHGVTVVAVDPDQRNLLGPAADAEHPSIDQAG